MYNIHISHCYVLITDSEAPKFDDCPIGFTTNTSSDQSTAYVTFDLPCTTDNSRGNVTVECFNTNDGQVINNLGAMVNVGSNDIQCNATDPSGNVNSSCMFAITVEGKMQTITEF